MAAHAFTIDGIGPSRLARFNERVGCSVNVETWITRFSSLEDEVRQSGKFSSEAEIKKEAHRLFMDDVYVPDIKYIAKEWRGEEEIAGEKPYTLSEFGIMVDYAGKQEPFETIFIDRPLKAGNITQDEARQLRSVAETAKSGGDGQDIYFPVHDSGGIRYYSHWKVEDGQIEHASHRMTKPGEPDKTIDQARSYLTEKFGAKSTLKTQDEHVFSFVAKTKDTAEAPVRTESPEPLSVRTDLPDRRMLGRSSRTEHPPSLPGIGDNIRRNVSQTAESVAVYVKKRGEDRTRPAGERKKRPEKTVSAAEARAEAERHSGRSERKRRAEARKALPVIALSGIMLADPAIRRDVPVLAAAGLLALESVRAARPERIGRRAKRRKERRSAVGVRSPERKRVRMERRTGIERAGAPRKERRSAERRHGKPKREHVALQSEHRGKKTAAPEGMRNRGERRRKRKAETAVFGLRVRSERRSRSDHRKTEERRRQTKIPAAAELRAPRPAERKAIVKLWRAVSSERMKRAFAADPKPVIAETAGMRPYAELASGNRERKTAVRRFAFALGAYLLLLVLENKRRPETAKPLPFTAGAVPVTDRPAAGGPETDDAGDIPAPWLMLSIVRYLAMIREQGKTTYVPVKRKHRKADSVPTRTLPQSGTIFAYGT